MRGDTYEPKATVGLSYERESAQGGCAARFLAQHAVGKWEYGASCSQLLRAILNTEEELDTANAVGESLRSPRRSLQIRTSA